MQWMILKKLLPWLHSELPFFSLSIFFLLTCENGSGDEENKKFVLIVQKLIGIRRI